MCVGQHGTIQVKHSKRYLPDVVSVTSGLGGIFGFEVVCRGSLGTERETQITWAIGIPRFLVMLTQQAWQGIRLNYIKNKAVAVTETDKKKRWGGGESQAL